MRMRRRRSSRWLLRPPQKQPAHPLFRKPADIPLMVS
jgi:hypothetical protein